MSLILPISLYDSRNQFFQPSRHPTLSLAPYNLDTMGFHIAPMLLPDIPRCFEIYISSFSNDVMGSIMLDVLYPGGITDEVRAGHAKATLDWLTHSTSQYNFKCVDTSTGEIVGMIMADWYIHGRTNEERAFAGIPWLEGKHRERAEKILWPLWRAREKYIGGQPHICKSRRETPLMLLGTAC